MPTSNKMSMRELGKLKVSVLGLGGQGILEDDDADKDIQRAVVSMALKMGITHFDTSPIYGDGNSETIYGEILSPVRDSVTIATKTEARDRDGALADLEKSLKRLKTDHVDIWFMHHLESEDEAMRCVRKNGVMKAMEEMRQEGVVGLVGASCHEDPMAVLKMMDLASLDVILIPVNPADPNMKPSFVRDVIPEARKASVGVIGMKVMSQGHLFSEGGLEDPVKAVRYSVGRGVANVIVACRTPEQVVMNAKAVSPFEPLDAVESDALEEKVAKRVRESCFFRKEFGGYSSKDEMGEPWIS